MNLYEPYGGGKLPVKVFRNSIIHILFLIIYSSGLHTADGAGLAAQAQKGSYTVCF